MNREEAIDFGEMWLDVNEDTKDSDTYMFIELATKALEQQPSEDCISIAEALNFLKGFETLHNHDELRSNLIDGIMNLPFVTPHQTRWIPCSERLPKEGQKVLITDKFEAVTTAMYFRKSPFWREMVFAWMPLPEPYKESEE